MRSTVISGIAPLLLGPEKTEARETKVGGEMDVGPVKPVLRFDHTPERYLSRPGNNWWCPVVTAHGASSLS